MNAGPRGVEWIAFGEKRTEFASAAREAAESVRPLEQTDGVRRLLFYIELNAIGENYEALRYVESIDPDGAPVCAALVVVSDSEFFTKTFARKFIFLTNERGFEWIGHPLVEITGSLANFRTWSKTMGPDLPRIAADQVKKLVQRLSEYAIMSRETVEIAAIHAGSHKLSNTLMLWDLVAAGIAQPEGRRSPCRVSELPVKEGEVADCFGCEFETCRYYGLSRSCFYGGFVVESLYPTIESADCLVMICPNYNDSISAKLMAVINRLTALYRSMSFREKYLYAIIVSGNSGSDSVAAQLIGALAINKGFRLPPHFALCATASDPGEVLGIPGIRDEADRFARRLVGERLRRGHGERPGAAPHRPEGSSNTHKGVSL